LSDDYRITGQHYHLLVFQHFPVDEQPQLQRLITRGSGLFFHYNSIFHFGQPMFTGMGFAQEIFRMMKSTYKKKLIYAAILKIYLSIAMPVKRNDEN
jgi:hypothetical protein